MQEWRKISRLFQIMVLVYFCANIWISSPILAAEFNFVVLGDNRTHHHVYKAAVEKVVALNPDFVINTGDMIGTAGNLSQWKKFWELSAPLKMPYYLTVGNHEVTRTHRQTNPEYVEIYKEQVNLPGNELYYSFTHKNSHFIVLDSEVYKEEWRITGKQFEWLEQDLASIREKTDHIFVFMHRPLYDPRWSHRFPMERDRLHDLLVKYKVEALFCGHNHAFHKSTHDGLTQIITGGAGAELYTTPLKGGFHHVVQVTVRDKDVYYRVEKIHCEPVYKSTVKLKETQKKSVPAIVAKKKENILIDGDMTDWKEAYPIVFTSKNVEIGDPKKEDFSLRSYFLYDDKNLYFAAEVTDDVISSKYSQGQDISIDHDFRDNDYLRLYVSCPWDNKQNHLGKNDYCFIFTPTGPDGKPMKKLCSYGGYDHKGFNLNQIQIASKIIKGKGYSIEATIPFSAIHLDPKKNLPIGVNVMAGDTDDPSKGRKSVYAFNFKGIANYWATPASFVPLILEGNLIKNPGFEQNLSGWSRWNTIFTIDEIYKHSGQKSLKVKLKKGKKVGAVWNKEISRIKIDRKASYLFSGWIKVAEGTTAVLYLRGMTEAGEKAYIWGKCIKGPTSGFVYSEKKIKPSDWKTDSYDLSYQIQGTGEAWFDDVSLKKEQKEMGTFSGKEYRLKDFVRSNPDTKFSYQDLRFAIMDTQINGYKMEMVLSDMGIPKERICPVGFSDTLDLSKFNILIIAQDIRVPEGDEKRFASNIERFVRQGGICWVLHQDKKSKVESLFPSSLENITVAFKNGMSAYGGKHPQYVGPWIAKRHHVLFNDPYYIDEADFSFWKPVIDGKTYFTSAFYAITHVSSWDILAKFADPKVRDGAMVMQAPFGKGLYLHTQIFSPQVVWNQKPYQEVWEKFMKNIFNYFVRHIRGEIYEVKSEPFPWSVEAGLPVEFRTSVKSHIPIESVLANVVSSSGKKIQAKMSQTEEGFYKGQFIPEEGGEYFVKVRINFLNGKKGYDHFFFKVTKGWTPYRFITHIHVRDCPNWNPQHVGLIFGGARYFGYDLVCMATYGKETWEDGFLLDNPACRSIPGQEFHYRVFEGKPWKSKLLSNNDFRAIDIPIPGKHKAFTGFDEARKVAPKYAEWVHNHFGFVVADDGSGKGSWQDFNLDIDGIEYWDKPPFGEGPSGKKLVMVSAIDLHGMKEMLGGRFNIIWMDKAFTPANFMVSLRKGRVAYVIGDYRPVRNDAREFLLWLDIGGEPIGGTIYAVDRVPISLQVKDRVGISEINVRDGKNRLVKKISGEGRKEVKETFWDNFYEDTHYYLNVITKARKANTNPIYVKKIDGPSGSWFTCTAEVKDATYDSRNGIWTIKLLTGGRLHFHTPEKVNRVTINSEEMKGSYDRQTMETEVEIPPGGGKVEILIGK